MAWQLQYWVTHFVLFAMHSLPGPSNTALDQASPEKLVAATEGTFTPVGILVPLTGLVAGLLTGFSLAS